jgi:hypothetical protein
MPVLTFPCAIHRLRKGPRVARRRVWIKGHDLRTLALAGTRQLGVPHHQCRYALISPDTKMTRRAFLEITHPDGDALVGPMAAPLPAPAMTDRGVALDALVDALGFGALGQDTECEEEGVRRHIVIVTYAPLYEHHPFPPVRDPRETDAQYQQRHKAAEGLRVERTSQQGIHLVRYDVPPEDWTAQDIDALMVILYRTLPHEPRWRETGTITQAKFVSADDGRVTVAHCLQVGRGEYVAHLRLPTFPVFALAEWLGYRRCDISLRQPVMRLELISRGWRAISRLDAGSRSSPVGELLAGWQPVSCPDATVLS